MPFIAITERAATRLVNEQYDALTRGSKVHEQLERLVIDGGGIDEITAAIAGAVGGSALVFDAGLHQVARHPSKGSPRADDVVRITEEIAGQAGLERRRCDLVRARDAAGPRARSCRFRAAAAPRRQGGSPCSPNAGRSASSSGSSPARLRSSSASS